MSNVISISARHNLYQPCTGRGSGRCMFIRRYVCVCVCVCVCHVPLFLLCSSTLCRQNEKKEIGQIGEAFTSMLIPPSRYVTQPLPPECLHPLLPIDVMSVDVSQSSCCVSIWKLHLYLFSTELAVDTPFERTCIKNAFF